LATKHDPRAANVKKIPSNIPVADILAAYYDEIAEKKARPDEYRRRLFNISQHFGEMNLGDITGAACRAYAKKRGKPQAARRELEDFRAAINHYFEDDLMAPKVNIVLPEKSQPRERWLTRSEAAKLIWTAWRKSQPVPKGKNGEQRYIARHIARFILVGLYTGSRAGAICDAALKPTKGRGHVDLETGLFYRRPPGERETTKRRPTIALPDPLLAHIRRWARLGLCKHSVIEWCGKPVKRVSKGFTAITEAAGEGFEDVIPHTLRHTAVTWTMQDGVDLWDAAGYFGMTVKVLEDVYGHHHPSRNKAVLDGVRQRRARRLEKSIHKAKLGEDQEAPPNDHR